jgi:hypothetical protein
MNTSARQSLEERLTAFVAAARAKADALPPGPERDAELEKVAKAEKAKSFALMAS